MRRSSAWPTIWATLSPAEIDLAAAELPAFLTEDEPGGIALNGASAP